jgi:hypothetical protein
MDVEESTSIELETKFANSPVTQLNAVLDQLLFLSLALMVPLVAPLEFAEDAMETRDANGNSENALAAITQLSPLAVFSALTVTITTIFWLDPTTESDAESANAFLHQQTLVPQDLLAQE